MKMQLLKANPLRQQDPSLCFHLHIIQMQLFELGRHCNEELEDAASHQRAQRTLMTWTVVQLQTTK